MHVRVSENICFSEPMTNATLQKPHQLSAAMLGKYWILMCDALHNSIYDRAGIFVISVAGLVDNGDRQVTPLATANN